MLLTPTMFPLSYHFYASFVLVSVVAGVSTFCMALISIYGIGGIELLLALGFVCFFGLLRLVVPSLSTTAVYYDPFTEEEAKMDNMAVETFILQENEKKTLACSCCPICLCTFHTGDEVSIAVTCRHTYHSDCLNMWLPKSATCPYCREDLEVKLPVEKDSSGVRKPGAWGVFEGIFDSVYA